MKRVVSEIRECALTEDRNGAAVCIARGTGGEIEVKAYAAGILRVEYRFDSVALPEDLRKASDFMTGYGTLGAAGAPRAKIRDLGDAYLLEIGHERGPATEVRLEKGSGAVSVHRGGKLILGGRVGNQDTVLPRFPVRCVSEGEGAYPRARFNFPLSPGDSFYGLGDKSGALDRRGRRFRMFNRDALGYDASNSDPLYKSIPFFLKIDRASGTACGLFFPAAMIEEVDLGLESPYYFKIEVKGGPFAYFVFTGDDYGEILGSYCAVAGLPVLPPLFSFGFFGSSMNYVEGDDAEERILRYFAQIEEHKIPCEGMYLSSGYLKSPEGKRYAFLWNHRKFPDYGAFLRSLSARGYNICANIKPGILTSHPWYGELARKGYLIASSDGNPYVEFFWGGEASFIDFSNPEARSWWKEQLRLQYLDHGCAGIWNDNNELELEDEGLPAFKTKSLYPVLMAETAYEAFKEMDPDARPWVYSRAGYAGLQRYARTWTGDNVSDWKTLRFNQYMGYSLGLSGLPFYGHDLGGFFGERPSEELLVRSCQSAVFQPRFVIHSWRKDDRPTEPWTYPGALESIRHFVREHYRFIPYTYNCAVESARSGVPIERPLFLEFPDDPDLRDSDTNCLFGPAVLKIPVVDERAEAAYVRFPRGRSWYDPSEGTLLPGGTAATVSAPLTSARWFAAAGSVVPTSPGLDKLASAFFPLVEFLIFPPEDDGSEYEYYEDDGRSEPSLGRGNLWSVSVEYAAASRRGSVRIVELRHGGSEPAGDRVFRLALPAGFAFVGARPVDSSSAGPAIAPEAAPAEAPVSRLRKQGGIRWNFEGGYFRSGENRR